MNYTDIENILSKKVTGEASSSELAILEIWKAESQANEEVYYQYATLWEDSTNYQPSVKFDFEVALDRHLETLQTSSTEIDSNITSEHSGSNTAKSTRVISFRTISAIAAMFVLGAAALLLFNTNSTTLTADDNIQFVSLDDGSNIWLDKGSSLTYDKGFGVDHRNIKLEGKAFFDVERNESIPFAIDADDLNVSVLGTSFTVDSKSDYVEVSTGTVKVGSENSQVVLKKNDKVELVDGILQTSVTNTNNAKWRNPSLSFDNSSLSQVVADINLYHNNRVVLKSEVDLTSCDFTSNGGLASLTLDEVIEILKLNYDLEVTKNTDNYEISISNCN